MEVYTNRFSTLLTEDKTEEVLPAASLVMTGPRAENL